MYRMNRDNTRRGVNHSSLFLPLDATIVAMELPKGDDHGAGDSDSAGEDTIEEEKSQEDVDEEDEEETFMSIGVDFGTT